MMDDPEYYKMALGIAYAIPSAETLRQRMDDIGSSLRDTILQANADMFKTYHIRPTALENGYAPMMAYIGTEGFLVNCELREGKQHCQKHIPEFLKETLQLCHQLTDTPLLIRLDSGNDAAKNLGILIEDGSWFILKRNLRRGESKDDWISLAKECCKDIRNPRDGKDVYVGSSWKDVTYTDDENNDKSMCMRISYEIMERSMDKHGQFLLPADMEANTWWTNPGATEDEVIAFYHAHGECEQYHSEIKTDMDVERLPSGKFETNELVLELSIIAYNILRIIGQASLKSRKAPKTRHNVKRRRLRTVISNLILIAGHITSHARKVVLVLGCSNTWWYAFMDLHQKFALA